MEVDGGEDILLPGKMKIIDFQIKYESKGYTFEGDEIFDFDKPYNLIICEYEQLESIHETIRRIL